MDDIAAGGDAMRELRQEIEQRFQLADLSLLSTCNPGHPHDGLTCGLDLTAHDSRSPELGGEFVVQPVPAHRSEWISSVHASGGCPQLVSRLSAAYLALVDDPRLGRAIDELDTADLCCDCEEPCTTQRGVHSIQRAVLSFECGSMERVVAHRLMSSWSGTGEQLAAVVRATTD
jgi:hypothetical protein